MLAGMGECDMIVQGVSAVFRAAVTSLTVVELPMNDACLVLYMLLPSEVLFILIDYFLNNSALSIFSPQFATCLLSSRLNSSSTRVVPKVTSNNFL